MARILSDRTIGIVKATVPALEAHGTEITRRMYARLFQDDHIRALFNHANQGENGGQVHALAAAILAYARHIDDLGALTPMVERIAHKHIGYHILPEHYPHVARALLAAIAEVLGEAATDEVIGAWGEAYWFLADILIGREAGIRRDLEALDGGWTGWRPLTVAERIRESEVITSFILTPQDGRPLAPHRPGQYLTLRLAPRGRDPIRRNYSISSAPGAGHYRISVKREAAGQGGSIFLHDEVRVGDTIKVTPPSGDFHLPDTPYRPVVLLSGGVGLTPMVSMLERIAANHPALETHFVHGTMSSATHALDGQVRALARGRDNLRVATFYSDPAPGDAPGKTHDEDGLISIDWLRRNTPLERADFYLCGPKPFLRAFVGGLAGAGVPTDRIRYEFFGPADEALAG